MKTKGNFWLQILVIYTRYLIGGAFVFASLIKIKGARFTTESGLDSPIDSAWHFFETLFQSGIYWNFIGMAQLLAGMLLMTQKYAKLGAVIFFPISLNIFMITVSYNFGATIVITALILLANLMLIMWDWNELKILINRWPKVSHLKTLEKDTLWTISGIILFLFTAIYRTIVDKYNIIFWFGTCFIIGLITFIVGLKMKSKYKNYEKSRES